MGENYAISSFPLNFDIIKNRSFCNIHRINARVYEFQVVILRTIVIRSIFIFQLILLYFRSTSVSRGLQVEEQDLIQFSGHQHQTQNENPSSESPSNNSSSKLIAPSSNNNNNNNGKSPLNKRSDDNGDERLNGNGDNPDNSKGRKDKCDDIKGDPSDVEGVDNNANDCEEDDEEETSSARTADEQMDYLESLEPCPCYAKCCLDSIITLFCVTLLG